MANQSGPPQSALPPLSSRGWRGLNLQPVVVDLFFLGAWFVQRAPETDGSQRSLTLKTLCRLPELQRRLVAGAVARNTHTR